MSLDALAEHAAAALLIAAVLTLAWVYEPAPEEDR